MYAVAALLSPLSIGIFLKWMISGAFIACGYGFGLALPLGAAVGHRGLAPTGPTVNRVIYLGNMVGVMGSLVGTIALLFAAFYSL